MNQDSMKKFEDEGPQNFDSITLQKDDLSERTGLYKQNPYINNGCEMPITSEFGPTWYKFRSWILYPIQKRIYKNFTVGELIFTLFVVQLFAITIYPDYFTAHSRGHHCAFLLGFVFLFTMKNSFFTFLCGIPYERQIYWHKILSVMLYPMILVHFHQAKENNPYDSEYDFTFQKHSGYTTFAAFFMIFIFSFHPVRRYCAKVFAVVHAICTPIIIIGVFAHRAGYARYAIIFFLFERLYRVCVTRFNKKNTVQARLVKMGNDIVKITFSKGSFNYMAGQYFFLSIPSISYFEWHPFFVSSQPEEGKIEFLVKGTGNWTKQLVRIAEADQEVKILVNGPYGNLHSNLDLEPYNSFLLISGGIGLAPIKSVAKNLVKQKNMGRTINRIQLAHSSKETQLSKQILDQDEMQELSQIQIYNTGRNSRNDVEQNSDSRVQVYNRKPSFDQIFQSFVHSVSSSQQSVHRVAVISSCPGKMQEDVQKSVNKFSSDYIKLDFYPQSYEF